MDKNTPVSDSVKDALLITNVLYRTPRKMLINQALMRQGNDRNP